MSIKSDKWIRRMAEEKGMIMPFAKQQVKESTHGKVISYGTSSYGYDVRCADEFKIFTNINSAIVDPKNFSEKSFVDVQADVCIIPPNSFALARTVEFFKIPRDVLTICLGKCVTAETRLLNTETGAYTAITEFSANMYTLALDVQALKSAKITDFIPQGKQQVYELTTAKGFKIQATAQHPFKQAHAWTELNKLRSGDKILTANYIPVFGSQSLATWELQLLGLSLSGESTQLPKFSGQNSDTVLRDLFTNNISAGNLSENNLHLWLAKHGLNVTETNKQIPAAIFTTPKADLQVFLQAFFSVVTEITTSTANSVLKYAANSNRLLADLQHLLLRFGISSNIASASNNMYELQIIGTEQITRFQMEIGFYLNSKLWKAAKILPSILLPELSATSLDVIISIEALGVTEVYDITVPKLHNFVANGLVVHNSTYARCGIIVNVTPLEPEWEGHVTLEFSNTTPLPAKIYANEGVAQMLFFGSDEVCEISYKDRKGKYQGQAGVTLPKA